MKHSDWIAVQPLCSSTLCALQCYSHIISLLLSVSNWLLLTHNCLFHDGRRCAQSITQGCAQRKEKLSPCHLIKFRSGMWRTWATVLKELTPNSSGVPAPLSYKLGFFFYWQVASTLAWCAFVLFSRQKSSSWELQCRLMDPTTWEHTTSVLISWMVTWRTPLTSWSGLRTDCMWVSGRILTFLLFAIQCGRLNKQMQTSHSACIIMHISMIKEDKETIVKQVNRRQKDGKVIGQSWKWCYPYSFSREFRWNYPREQELHEQGLFSPYQEKGL